MNTYYVSDDKNVYIVNSDAKVTYAFLEWLQELSGVAWEAVKVPAPAPDKLPLPLTIFPGKTFKDWMKLIELYQAFRYEPVVAGDSVWKNIYCVVKFREKYVFTWASYNWIRDFGLALGITVEKVYDPFVFTSTWLLEGVYDYYKGVQFEDLKTLKGYLDLVLPVSAPSYKFVPGYEKDIAAIKTANLALPPVLSPGMNPLRLNCAEMAVLRQPGLRDLRLTQLIFLREWLYMIYVNTGDAPRTSDLTAAFNEWYGFALQEIGTHLKILGFTNKRTAAGYVWPELTQRETVLAKIVGCKMLYEMDIFPGTASLFNDL